MAYKYQKFLFSPYKIKLHFLVFEKNLLVILTTFFVVENVTRTKPNHDFIW